MDSRGVGPAGRLLPGGDPGVKVVSALLTPWNIQNPLFVLLDLPWLPQRAPCGIERFAINEASEAAGYNLLFDVLVLRNPWMLPLREETAQVPGCTLCSAWESPRSWTCVVPALLGHCWPKPQLQEVWVMPPVPRAPERNLEITLGGICPCAWSWPAAINLLVASFIQILEETKTKFSHGENSSNYFCQSRWERKKEFGKQRPSFNIAAFLSKTFLLG